MKGKIKGIMIFFIIIGFTCYLNIVPANAETSIRVGAYDNPPKIFLDENNNYVGIFPDILNHIADKEGWKVEYINCIWNDCLEKLENNEIDMMVDVAYSDERDERFDFNKVPVITNWAMSYSHVNEEYTSATELEGKTISVLRGSIHTDGPDGIKALLQDFDVDVNFLVVDSYFDVLGEVDKGNADLGIVNRLFGLINEQDFENIQRSFLVFNPVALHFGFTQGVELSEYLINRIDSHLTTLLNDLDSEYYAIMNEYLYEIDGSDRIPEWIVPSILGFLGLVIFLVVINIVFKKRLDQKTAELREHIEGQEKEIQKATQHLLDANERLKELDKLKSIFLASMSHELRTPLNSIIGFTRILLMKMAGELNEEQEKQLGLVDKSAHHLLELINDILDISKIESESIEFHFDHFNLNALVEECITTMNPQVKEKGLEISLVSEKSMDILGDKRRVKQVLLNLLSNSVKFSDEGVISVGISAKDEDYFEIVVEDQGIGIAEKDQDKIFDPFQQVDMSTTKEYEGTGLGLYICKKLTTALGGDLSLTSELGRGTRVTFYLPIQGGLRA